MLPEPYLPGLEESISVFLAEKRQKEPPLLDRAPLGRYQTDLQTQSLPSHFAFAFGLQKQAPLVHPDRLEAQL